MRAMLPVIRRDLCTEIHLKQHQYDSSYERKGSNVNIQIGKDIQIVDRQSLSAFLMGKHQRLGSKSPVSR